MSRDTSSLFDSEYSAPEARDTSSLFDPDYSAPAPVKEERGDTMAGVLSGANSFMSLMNYSKAAIGALSDNEDWIREGINTAEQYELKAAEYGKGRVTDWDKVTDAGSFIDYFQYGLGTLAPYAAESVVTGAIGAVAGSAAAPGPGTVTGTLGGMVAKQAAKDLVKQYAKKELKGLSKEAIEKKVKKNFREYAQGTILPQNKKMVESAMKRTAMKMGATMGSFAGTYPVGMGDVASNMIEDDGTITKESAQLSAGLAVPYAALDVLPEFVGLSRMLTPGGGGLLKRMASGFVAQAPIESATEVAQEEINIRTRAAHDPDFDPSGREAWVQRREGGILGFAGGGVFGAASGLAGGNQQLQSLELDVSSNIKQVPKSDFKSVDDYNQAIIDGIYDTATELTDHGAIQRPGTEAGPQEGPSRVDQLRQMEIDQAPEIGSTAERRQQGMGDTLPMGQQIDTLFAEAMKTGLQSSGDINQFVIDSMYPQGRPLVDHGAEQRPTPEVERQAEIDRITAAEVIPPTPDMMAQGLGMFPVEQRADTELPAVNPNDYDRATLEASIRDVKKQQSEAEAGEAKTVLSDLAAGGGIDWDMALSEGLDPKDMRAANLKGMPFGKPLFRRGSGNGFDWAAERFSQSGVSGFQFGETYEQAIGSANDALALVSDMIQGKRDPVYIPGDEYAEMDRQSEVRRLEGLMLTLENMLDEVGDYQMLLETHGQDAADQFFYNSRMMDQYAEEMRAGMWQPGDPVTVNTEFDEAGERLSYLLDKAYEVDPETAMVEFERLVDATDAEIAAAMYQIIGRSEDAETRAEAERAIERAEAEPAAEREPEQRGEEPGDTGEVPTEEAGRRERETEVKTERRAGERRLEQAERKRVSEMSDAEKTEALLTNEKSGLRNERAYQEDDRLKHQAFFDIDNFKQINDRYTYDGADLILAALGKIMIAASNENVIPYHLHGDEFIVQSNSFPALKAFSEKVQKQLNETEVTIELPNKETQVAKNVGASYGIGNTKDEAEATLKKDKAARAATGVRTERERDTGELPDEAAARNEDRQGGLIPAERVPENGDITTADIDAAAAEAEKSPSEAKIKADNYKKGIPFKLNKWTVRIETERGERRRPEFRPLANHYGHILGTKSSDGDPLDILVLDNAGDMDMPVFVVDQVDPDKMFAFDEAKIIAGAPTEASARAAYLANYEDNWQGLGGITEFTWDEFNDWVENGDTTKRITAGNEVEPEQQVPEVEPQESVIGKFTQLHNAMSSQNGQWGEITGDDGSTYRLRMPSGNFVNTGKHLVTEIIDMPPVPEAEATEIPAEADLTQPEPVPEPVPTPTPEPYVKFEGRDITWEQETEDGWVTVTVDSADVLRDYDNRINALNQLVKDCG